MGLATGSGRGAAEPTDAHLPAFLVTTHSRYFEQGIVRGEGVRIPKGVHRPGGAAMTRAGVACGAASRFDANDEHCRAVRQLGVF
jgi:hypothetical protein